MGIELTPLNTIITNLEEAVAKRKECEKRGNHIGQQIIWGPGRGRYSPNLTMKCEYCRLFYERRMTSEEVEEQQHIRQTPMTI
ncbi:hypothetical protein HY485_01290 [Candidatus Woesearchaeota archaeon]|nr:hypothetical protein [Candidatus Woesearchaeota archaeon]